MGTFVSSAESANVGRLVWQVWVSVVTVPAWSSFVHSCAQREQMVFEVAQFGLLLVFSLEAVLKIGALGVKYFKRSSNWLDFLVVIIGYVGFIPDVPNLVVLRLLRILRCERLAQI